jgi:cytosine/uracil/thiamine/allantoin permease
MSVQFCARVYYFGVAVGFIVGIAVFWLLRTAWEGTP